MNIGPHLIAEPHLLRDRPDMLLLYSGHERPI